MKDNNSNIDESDSDNQVVKLWDREESPILQIELCQTVCRNKHDDDDDHHHHDNNNQRMKLRQFGSDNDKWGIHSMVWDGGLALVPYLVKMLQDNQHPNNNNNNNNNNSKVPLLLDLGSGTGIVGIAMAMMGYTKSIITDLPISLPLLHENKQLNQHSLSNNEDDNVIVMELSWGSKKLSDSIVEQLTTAYEHDQSIMIVGADIIYRQNLFDPLLNTLCQLFDLLSNFTTKTKTTTTATNPFENNDHGTCTTTTTTQKQQHQQYHQGFKCIIASQSIRQHEDKFWEKAAREYGLRMMIKAVVNVKEATLTDNAGGSEEEGIFISLPSEIKDFCIDNDDDELVQKKLGFVHICEVFRQESI